MRIVAREARPRRVAICLCATTLAAGATVAACAPRFEIPTAHTPAAKEPPGMGLEATGTTPTPTSAAASRVPPLETPSDLTITGTVMDTSLSARVILLEEPAEGCDAIALTEESRLVLADGSEIALRQIHRGRTVKAFGHPGPSNTLIAYQVILLRASPQPAASPAPSTTPGPAPTRAPPAAPSPLPSAWPTRVGHSAEASIIRSFSAAPGAGETISLTWDAVGDEVTICPLIDATSVGCRCLFGLPPTGSAVIPCDDIIGAYTGFQLTVRSEGVRVAHYSPVVVECPRCVPGWFFAEAPRICPGEPPLASSAAAQRFEHGLMIWIEALDTYYVLYDRFFTPAGRPSPSATLRSLQIVDGPLDLAPGASPDSRVDETPPDGRFEPISGFGLVWRGEVVGTEGIRARLGLAEEQEHGFATVYQCEMNCGSYWDCYLQGPNGQILHLYWLAHAGHFWEPVG